MTSWVGFCARPPSSEKSVKTLSPISNMPEAAANVAETTAEEEKPAEGERVGVEHPRQRRRAEAEVGVDARERDVHHGDVQHQHELGHEHDRDPRRGATGVRRQVAREVPLSVGVAGGQCEMTRELMSLSGPERRADVLCNGEVLRLEKLYGDTLRLASEVDPCAPMRSATGSG